MEEPTAAPDEEGASEVDWLFDADGTVFIR